MGGRLRAAAERLRGKKGEEAGEDGAPAEKPARPARAKGGKTGRTDTRGKGKTTAAPRKAGGS